MHKDHEAFIQGIHTKKMIQLTFFSKEDNSVLVRRCAPMDYGPSRRDKIKADKYHMWDYGSDNKPHTLSLLPNQVKSIELTEESFEPEDFVNWEPNWIIERDWGQLS